MTESCRMFRAPPIWMAIRRPTANPWHSGMCHRSGAPIFARLDPTLESCVGPIATPQNCFRALAAHSFTVVLRGLRSEGFVALASVGNTPDCTARVVRNQQRSVFSDRQCGGTSPHFRPLLTRNPEPGGEVLVESFRSAVLERHAHNLVADRLRTIPRALESYESATFVLWRELVTFIESEVEHRRMCFK